MPRKRKKTRAVIIQETSWALVEKLYSRQELRIIRKVTAWMDDATMERAMNDGGYPDSVFDFIPGHVLVATTDPAKDNLMPDLHTYTYDELLEKYEIMKEIRQDQCGSGRKDPIRILFIDVGLP
jgi:hypothetical protein